MQFVLSSLRLVILPAAASSAGALPPVRSNLFSDRIPAAAQASTAMLYSLISSAALRSILSQTYFSKCARFGARLKIPDARSTSTSNFSFSKLPQSAWSTQLTDGLRKVSIYGAGARCKGCRGIR